MTSPLVSTDWLAEHLDDANVKIIDGSWYLPQMQRDADAEYVAAHIPGAVRFDIDSVADISRPLPHMVADAQTFGRAAGMLGLRETDTIVVYDGMGLFSAARVWWNFRIMGATNTKVLAGGMPKWTSEQRPVETGSANPAPTTFNARLQSQSVADAAQIAALISGESDTQIVDMRPALRFSGEAAEPRPELQSGHMPNSLNLPFTDLVDAGTLLDAKALRDRIAQAGIDTTKPIVTSCGSGVTATILNLALAEIGVDAMRVYDGSWAEWGLGQSGPIETGS